MTALHGLGGARDFFVGPGILWFLQAKAAKDVFLFFFNIMPH